MTGSIIEFLWSNEPIRAVQQFFSREWLWLFVPITFLGAHEVAALVVALAFWLIGRRLAYALIGIVFFALATDMLLWQIVGIPRPTGPDIFVYKDAPVSSFPSGHVVTATVVWGLLAAGRQIRTGIALGIVLAVMLSRLYLGMHYLGDIVAGAVLGLLLLGVYLRVWPVIAHWLARRSLRFFLLGGLGLCLAVLPFTWITERAWLVFGTALGAVLGLSGEYRYVHYVPRPASVWETAEKVLVGGIVAGALVWGHGIVESSIPIFDAVVFMLIALWFTLGAPALFIWLDLADETRVGR